MCHAFYHIPHAFVQELLTENQQFKRTLENGALAWILRQTDRFFDKPIEQLLRIAGRFDITCYNQGEKICDQGDQWPYYAVVLQQCVKIATRLQGYQGAVGVGNALSNFQSVRSQYIVSTLEGNLKLGGFGWSKKVRDRTYTKIRADVIQYISPEVSPLIGFIDC